MRFDIVIPVYNGEKYLEQCVESIRGQKCDNFQIVLVDDGSRDSSGRICDEFAQNDSRIRVLHQQNGGVMCARYAGAELCAGDYILFFDADDIMAPNLLTEATNAAESNADVIAFGLDYLRNNEISEYVQNMFSDGFCTGKNLEQVKKHLIYSNKKRSFNYGSVLYSMNKFFRRDFFSRQKITIPREIAKGEDMLFTVNAILHAQSVYFMNTVGIHYRIAAESVMNTFRESDARNILLVCNLAETLFSRLPKRNICVWAMSMCIQYAKSASAMPKDLFVACMQQNITKELLCYLKHARVTLPRREDMVYMRYLKTANHTKLYDYIQGRQKTT